MVRSKLISEMDKTHPVKYIIYRSFCDPAATETIEPSKQRANKSPYGDEVPIVVADGYL